MGDIPGITYTTPADVDATGLPGFGAVPEVHRDPGFPPSLWWTYAGYGGQDGDYDDYDDFTEDPGSGTSASPAHEHSARSREQQRTPSVENLGTTLAQTLELPGEPVDYHFAIQHAVQQMHVNRHQGPHVLAKMEQLAWLDLDLIQAAPDAVRYDDDGEVNYYTVLAFTRLLELYGREGLLADAVHVADIAERFGADNPAIGNIRERAAAVAAEDQVH